MQETTDANSSKVIKRNRPVVKGGRIAYRIEGDIVTWVKRGAAQGNVKMSVFARRFLYAGFEKRNAK